MSLIPRRKFLAGAGALGVTGAAALTVGRQPIADALGLDTSDSPKGVSSGTGTLVLLALYGGNDGLNTLVPYADSVYQSGRPTIGFKPDEVLTLDSELGLNPNLPGIKTLWEAKQLAIVRGVGHADPTFSHFREMDIWQSGDPVNDVATGWLGRYIDVARHDPLFSLSLGPTMPLLLQGATSAGSAIPSGTLKMPKNLAQPFTVVETPYPGEPLLENMVAQSGADLLTVINSVNEVLQSQPAVFGGTNLEGPPGTTAPSRSKPSSTTNAVAQQLEIVARLIRGGLPTRVYVVSMGSFDTHGGEKDTQDRLLAELDSAVTPFVQAMASDPRGKDVVLMTFSEFGRRVAENASAGTDHGSSAPLFVAGPSVKGGYYGEQPSLEDLDDGNLQYTTDFRSVYATVAGQVLGIDPKTVLEGQTFPTLGFV